MNTQKGESLAGHLGRSWMRMRNQKGEALEVQAPKGSVSDNDSRQWALT